MIEHQFCKTTIFKYLLDTMYTMLAVTDFLPFH